MKYYEPSYYSEFMCASSKCTDTCCRYWQVELDKITLHKYSRINNNSEISRRINKALSASNKSFKNNEDGNCPFLNKNLLCDLHTAVGHENLPRTCRLYPRFYNTFGGYEERGLSFSCPTAAKLIFDDSFNFIEYENDLPIIDYTDVNAELFCAVKEVRNKILSYISTADCEAEIMLAVILEYSKKVQQNIDSNQINAIKSIELIDCNCQYEIFSNIKLRLKTIRLHKHLKILRKPWKNELKFALNNNPNVEIYALKVWLTYFIYRYLINASYDKLFLSKVKASVLSFIVISCLNLPFEEAMQKYSKEIEHNNYNINKLFKLASKLKF